jgi:hypothetical protein
VADTRQGPRVSTWWHSDRRARDRQPSPRLRRSVDIRPWIRNQVPTPSSSRRPAATACGRPRALTNCVCGRCKQTGPAYQCSCCRQVNQNGEATGGVDGRRTSYVTGFYLFCATYRGPAGQVVCREHKPGSSSCTATHQEKDDKQNSLYSRPGARQGHTATLVGDTTYTWSGDRVYKQRAMKWA